MKVVKVHQKQALPLAAKVLEKGGIVFAPTDTIYGLLADATKPKAVEKLYSIRRPSGRPFILLLPDKYWLEVFDIYAKPTCWDLLDAHITIIFYKRTTIPMHLTRGKKSLAFRVPKRGTFIRDLLLYLDAPLVAPSANPEGMEPAKDVKMAMDYFGDNVDLYVDAGRIEGKPSTIVRLIGKNRVRLVREGNVSFKEFLQFAKRL